MLNDDFVQEVYEVKDAVIYELESIIERCRSRFYKINEPPKNISLVPNELYDSLVRALVIIDPENQLLKDSTLAQEFFKVQALLNSDSPYQERFKSSIRNAMVEYSCARSEPLIEFPAPLYVKQENRYTGKTIVFTGFYPEEKVQLFPIIELLKINQRTSVVKKMDFLICGTNAGPAKVKKCMEFGIPIVQAKDFIEEILCPEQIAPSLTAHQNGANIVLSLCPEE